MPKDSEGNRSSRKPESGAPPPKKIVFDDFQITRSQQTAQVEEERRVWQERQERTEQQKPGLFRFAVPRIKSLKDEMLGVQNKLPFLRRNQREEIPPPAHHNDDTATNSQEPFFAEHERSVVRVSRVTSREEEQLNVRPISSGLREQREFVNAQPIVEFESEEIEEVLDEPIELVEAIGDEVDEEEDWDEEEEQFEEDTLNEPEEDEEDEDGYEEEYSEVEEPEAIETSLSPQAAITSLVQEPIFGDGIEAEINAAYSTEDAESELLPEPRIEPTHKAFLDSLRSFDSVPRRAHEARDPRADFVVLLGELLDILREQVDATSAMFFWVNTKRQQLVLESAALDDRAYQFLAKDKRFPIELDAVSRIVNRRKPELLSSIPAQAERDLIPYYRDAIGIASFAGMPVLFGDGIVAVLTVDSAIEDNFNAETLRILTNHSKLISGLIRSYIEQYDLLASARTLDAARKLHQMVSPDTSLRIRDKRKNPDYVLRALTEAASEIIDWDWLAATSFDESRRQWSISSLQSKHSGTSYVPPMTPISLAESFVGKCLQTGKSMRHDSLGAQSIRYNIEEDRNGAIGHSFLVIPIRTTSKNYGALAIEHTDKARFTDADVETLEHLARSAATALEIIALSEIVGERSMTDLLTDSFNKRGLIMRAKEELTRAMAFDEPLTFVLFEIDGASEFASRFSQEDSDTIVLALVRLLRFSGRAFDVIGRTAEFTFAVMLIKMTDEEAYLWSEKMRKMIVSEVIAIGKRSFSVTVSIGVSGARRDGTVEELIEGAELALERAREVGGNNVIVY